jgi:uncharacterized protein (TIGR02271 family)
MGQNPANSKSADVTPGGAVVNWDRVIHKNVRTLDNQGMGKIIAVPNDEDVIIISSQSGRDQYKIPRSLVSGFNGAEVLLNITAYKVASYQVDKAGVHEAGPSDIISEEKEQEEEVTIPLIEERLNVSKRTSTTQANITKEPVIEKETIEVPVTHEELVVERRPAKDSSPSPEGPIKSRTEIRVLLSREQVEVTKKPFVKEEIVVKKKPVTETRTVSDTVTSERIDMSGAAMRQHTTTGAQE